MPAAPPETGPGRGPRIVFLGERAVIHGGGETSLTDLVRGIATAGFDPLVLLPGPGPIASICRSADLAWEPFPLPRLRRPFAVAAAVLRLARLIRRTAAAVIHTGGPRAALIGGLAARWTGTPHVFHVRASRPERWPGDPLILALADRVLAVSHAAARRSPALAASPKVRVVPTGIPPIAFLDRIAARVVLGIPPGAPVCGVVGRVEADKGARTVLAAWPAVRASWPGARLAFLGTVHPSIAARHDGGTGDVLFLGDHPGGARYLKAFDCLVHAARHEALPRVLIEAAFAGVPVVATRVGGVPEILPDGTCARLVDPDDPPALAGAVLALANNSADRMTMAGNARQRAEKLFNLETMIRLVRLTYEDLLLDHAATPRPMEARSR